MEQKQYNNRTYRLCHSGGRSRRSFCAKFRKSDLWIAVDAESYSPKMARWVVELLGGMWAELESYIATNPDFAPALSPLQYSGGSPLAEWMCSAGKTAEIGPMGAVAGAFAQRVGEALTREWGCREVIVENGGDIYLHVESDCDIAIFAGESPLSERVGLHIPAAMTPLGVCTSSGTVGPSLSLGRGDAMAVVHRDTAVADALATAFCNRIQMPDDVEAAVNGVMAVEGVLGALAIKADRMAVAGEMELRIFRG